GQLGIAAHDALDLIALARTEPYFRIETPDAGEQALAAQHLVAAGDAAAEVMRHVEERGVAVDDLRGKRQEIIIDASGGDRGMRAGQELDRAFGPDAPMAEEAARDPHRHIDIPAAEDIRCHEIEQNAVVIAGIERDARLRARGNDALHDIERTIAVEGRDLDRRHLLDLGEAAPETRVEGNAADRRL